MIHVFECAGQKLALDVASGALHKLDDLAYKVVSFMERHDLEQIQALLPTEDRAEVAECYAELCELKEKGQLFTQMEENEQTIDDGGLVKALCLHVAHDCNLRCAYCFASTGDFEGTRCLMPYEVGQQALDFLIAHSGQRHHLEVDFFGGEPMMNFGVVQRLVAYGRQLEQKHHKQFKFTITTNCYTLPPGAVAFCDAEMGNVVLSLDGRKEVHDAVRPCKGGGGSYDKALANAQALAAHRQDKDYYARGTFTRKNLDFTKDAIALLEAGMEHISLEPVVLEQTHPLSLREEDMERIEEEYERLLDELLKRKQKNKPYDFFHFMVDLSQGPCLRKRLSGCGAGREYLAVTPQGDLYPCHQFVGREGYRMGNVFDGIQRPAVRAGFLDNHIGKKEACAQCWAQYFCSGGCAANAQAFSGSILSPNPNECRLMRKRLECALAFQTMQEEFVAKS